MERCLAAILAAGVVGYSRLMAEDEEGTLSTFVACRAALSDLVAEHGGRTFGAAGDSMMAEFPSPVQAVRAAVAIQRDLQRRNADLPQGRRLEFRIGINLGDVMAAGDNLVGDGVNVAARVQEAASPSGICISGSVQEHIESKLDFPIASLGECSFKNIPRPVRLYRVSWRPDDPIPTDLLSGAPAQPDRPSVAVLPFVNMSGDPEQEYFSDGITEDIITDLSKISGLFVVARNTTFTYKGNPVKVQQLSQDIGVKFILEGSVRKAGSRVRVTAQLVEGKDGGHLWADRYDRDLTDIFAIQDEITHTIVDQLKVKLLPEERKVIDRAPTENFEAYNYYLRGRQFLHRHSESYYVLAKRMFAKAVELDPLYARAHAGIADCDSFLFLHYNADVSIDGILATSAKALDLEGGLAEAHASRGLALSLRERYPEAMAEFDHAIALDPNLFEAHYFYARACFAQGKLDEAARHFQRAAEIRPDDYQALLVVTGIYRSLGREQDMKMAAREGVARAERALTLHPENPRSAYLGAIGLAVLGELDRAKEWAARALAIDPDDGLAKYNVACFYSLVGEHERAIDLVVELLPGATHERKRWVKHDSDFDPIRSHPRFSEVLELLE